MGAVVSSGAKRFERQLYDRTFRKPAAIARKGQRIAPNRPDVPDGQSFRAKGYGTCAACGKRFEPMEWIRYDGEMIVHKVCPMTLTDWRVGRG